MNDTFCSDIVALFWNHIWECDSCYRTCFLTLLLLILFIMSINSLFAYFLTKSESLSYKTKYKKLKAEYDLLKTE